MRPTRFHVGPGSIPPSGEWGKPLLMALGVHALLAAALAWGVSWKQSTPPVFEAELWSALPQSAAPALIEPTPEPTEQADTPPPAKPEAAVPEAPKPAPPAPKPPDIAEQKKTDKERLAKAQAAKEKALAKSKQDALEKKKAADEKAKKEALAKKQAAAEQAAKAKEAQRREQQRQEQIRRMMGQAGAQGSPSSKGSAPQSSGPSASYGARVAARIKPNVVLTDPVLGNPRAEVEVVTNAEGTIVSRRLVKSSGNAAWDQAVLRAIDRTGTLPKDVDGRTPSPLIIGLRPLD